MTNARKAVEHAIRLLDARDRLPVVVYDTEVDVLLESVSATAEAKATAAKRLAGIDARGGTDLASGWLAGLEQVSRLRAGASGATDAPNEAISKVLLLSDGLANQGITDHDALAQRAAEFRAKGVATSTFGVGADFDEVLMTRLATQGGGHFYFIETARPSTSLRPPRA
jgi:Ca-activated chloride channel family protein